MKDKHSFVSLLHERVQKKFPVLASSLTKKDLVVIFNETIDCLKDVIKEGEPIRFHGFGIFELYASKRRRGRNPQTGEVIDIPPRKKVKFRTSKSFADEVIDL